LPKTSLAISFWSHQTLTGSCCAGRDGVLRRRSRRPASTRFDADGAIIRGLAQKLGYRVGHTFNLATGVTFHDGTTMDAEDVKFSP
jgi:hypothetical protein